MATNIARVARLLAPVIAQEGEVDTNLGTTKTYWVRKHLLDKPPLVLIHGYAAGAGCFFRNVQEMAADRAILMIDIPGFGESDRPVFTDEPEKDWVAALKHVFKTEINGPFWLVGHSFGCYLAARMCLENDVNIEGIILLDAWGFKENSLSFDERLAQMKAWQRGVYHTFKKLKLNGLDALRMVPKSMGPSLLKRFRGDLRTFYGDECLEYICEINSVLPATGEAAFAELGAGFGYAKYPMGQRLVDNASTLPTEIHFIYGGKSWVESKTGYKVQSDLLQKHHGINCTVSIVDEAKHHLMVSHPEEVNQLVNQILSH